MLINQSIVKLINTIFKNALFTRSTFKCIFKYIFKFLFLLSLSLTPFTTSAEIKSEKAFTPEMLFQTAIRAGEVQDVKLLIEKGLDPNQAFKDGITPLHIAVINNQESVLQVLLEAGANPNAHDTTTGATPLHLAAVYGRVNLAAILLQHGAKIDEMMKLGITPLLCAAQFKHAQMIEALLDKKANINKIDEEGFSALHVAAQNNDEATAMILIKRGAKLNIKDKTNQATPMKIATDNNAVGVMKILQEAGGEL